MSASRQSKFCADVQVARLAAGTVIEVSSQHIEKLALPILGGAGALMVMVLKFGRSPKAEGPMNLTGAGMARSGRLNQPASIDAGIPASPTGTSIPERPARPSKASLEA